MVYHVQTEDKGLTSPLILSLIYVGGAILASKRSPYDDLIATGFSENALAERLQRQHKLICAAISAGRIEDLRNMSNRDTAGRADHHHLLLSESDKAKQPEHTSQAPAHNLEAVSQTPLLSSQPATTSTHPGPSAKHDTPKAPPLGAGGEVLHLKLLEEKEFRAGAQVTLKISVTRGAAGEAEGKQAIAGASVTIKVLGSTFQPVVLSATTEQDGIAIVRTTLPRFASGRAAILVRAAVGGSESELRRIIHQA